MIKFNMEVASLVIPKGKHLGSGHCQEMDKSVINQNGSSHFFICSLLMNEYEKPKYK